MTPHLVVEDFSLRHTLECGQFFRWKERDGVYEVCRRDRAFRVWQDGRRLFYTGVGPAYVRYFFSLDHDLPGIARAIDKDPIMHEAVRRYWGLRLLRQDPWECTVAFVTSIASNIPRITGNLEDMARAFGTAISFDGRKSFEFPRPGDFGDAPRLRRLGLGFRARYLVDAARLCSAGLLDDLSYMTLDEAREALMVVQGIAEKVADCVLLYAFGHLQAFPVDTWIRKVMTLAYFGGKKAADRAIREFAAGYFGRYAGYAQQYLYVHSRENWDAVESAAARKPIQDALAKIPLSAPKVAIAASR